jgi:peptidylprolyl isomerase
VRKTAALVLAVGLMASLAACSPSESEDDAAAVDCTPVASGELSDAVEVSGTVGEKPDVTIDFPVTATASQRTVVEEGDGTVAAENYNVTADYTMFNGATGEEVDASTYDGSPAAFALDGTLYAGLADTIQCSAAGSRVVGVVPADGLIETTLTAFGMTAEDSMVIVVDVISAEAAEAAAEEVVLDPADYLAKADGADQPLPDGFPAIGVEIADDASGTPTVTIPDGDAPADLQIAVLKKGDGATIEAGADVVVNYSGTVWASKTIFDSSWQRGAIAHFPTDEVIPGFTQALEGQTIGSQVLVTIPPDLGYGETGIPDAGISGTDTLVFLVDILGVVEE